MIHHSRSRTTHQPLGRDTLLEQHHIEDQVESAIEDAINKTYNQEENEAMRPVPVAAV